VALLRTPVRPTAFSFGVFIEHSALDPLYCAAGLQLFSNDRI